MSRIDHATMRGILYTDQYQLPTMAQLYYRMGLHELEVQFDHYFRRNPDYDQHQAATASTPGWIGRLTGCRKRTFARSIPIHAQPSHQHGRAAVCR